MLRLRASGGLLAVSLVLALGLIPAQSARPQPPAKADADPLPSTMTSPRACQSTARTGLLALRTTWMDSGPGQSRHVTTCPPCLAWLAGSWDEMEYQSGEVLGQAVLFLAAAGG